MNGLRIIRGFFGFADPKFFLLHIVDLEDDSIFFTQVSELA